MDSYSNQRPVFLCIHRNSSAPRGGHSLNTLQTWPFVRVYVRMYTQDHLRQEGPKVKQEIAIMHDEKGGVFDNYRSVWAYEYVSVWKREATKLYQTFSAALICMNFTARKSQSWYPSWESCTHTETLTKLSFFQVVRSTSTWLSVSACQSEGFWLYKGKLRTGNRLRSESGRRCWTHPKQKVVSLSQVAIRT